MRDSDPEHTAKSALAALTSSLESLSHVWQPHYQTTPAYTIGGSSDTYTLPNPYDSPAEFCVVGVVWTGTGTAALSASAGVAAPGTSDVLNGGPTRQVFADSKTTLIECWQNIYPSGQLSLAVNVSGGACWVMVQFRRRRNQAGMVAEG